MTSDPRIGPITLPHSRSRRVLESLLEDTGITLNGDAPWDPRIYHPDFCSRILRQGSLGLGESYMDGWWECERLDELAQRLLLHGLGERARPPPTG
nr:hypothetical protein [Halomonas sp. ANAO-440]